MRQNRNEGPAPNMKELENKSQERGQGGPSGQCKKNKLTEYGNIIFHFPGRYFKYKYNTNDTV